MAHADAAADHPSALLALNGSVVARKADGSERVIAAGDLFAGFLESSLEPTEMITEVRIPKHTGLGWNFQKFNRRAQDWAIVGVSAQRTGDGNGARVALVNMGPTPLRAAAVEAALSGGAGASEAAAAAAEGTEPSSDLNATVDYREHLARVLTRRALEGSGIG